MCLLLPLCSEFRDNLAAFVKVSAQMPNGGLITSAYLFEDFEFDDDNNLLVPGQDWSSSTAIPDGATAELDEDASPITIVVSDDDPEFNDGFQEPPSGNTSLNQLLAQAVMTTNADGDAVNIALNSVLEVEFTLTAVEVDDDDDPVGDPIDFLFVAVGAPGSSANGGNLFLVVTTAPLTPGATYEFTADADGGGTPYQDIPCFARGTLIDTPDGPQRVETLQVGDLVSTIDGPARRIAWRDKRTVLSPAFNHRPVRIAAGAFGAGAPARDLYLSPQHSVLVSDRRLAMYFDSTEVLIRAGHLVGLPGVTSEAVGVVEYVHIMVDGHAVILCEGLATETFYPGPDSRAGLSAPARAELCKLYPNLSDPAAEPSFDPARPILKAFEARMAVSVIEDDAYVAVAAE